MIKKDYAIVFERQGSDEQDKYVLKAIDYVIGEEKKLKNGKKIFVVDSNRLKEKVFLDLNNEPFYLEMLIDNKIKFMENSDAFQSRYVYGSPLNISLFKNIVEYNNELSMFGDNLSIKEIEDTSDEMKEMYLEALKEYDFVQYIIGDGKIATYYARRTPFFYQAYMNDVIKDIVTIEMDLECPETNAEDKYKAVFKKIPESINVKKIYEECKKYIIGQDEHILPVLCAIDDNLSATIPEEKTNVLVGGPTGVGKTAVFKRIAEMIGLPIIIENSTQFTKAGYVGRNIDDIFEDLIEAANNDIELAQRGIIIIDEIDKKASGKDDSVSGVGVIHSMLKLLEGGEYTYETGKGSYSELKKFNTLNTTIAFGGAFSGLYEQCITKKSIGFGSGESVKPCPIEAYGMENLEKYGIPPEFFGRIQLLELFNALSFEDLKKILIEAKVNPYSLFINKMKRFDTVVKNDESFIDAVAMEAFRRKTGARGLYSVMKDVTKKAEGEIRMLPKYKRELILTPECIQDNNAYTLKRVYKSNKSATLG